MRYLIFLVLLVFLIVFTVQNYKNKKVVENFSQNYIKDVKLEIINIRQRIKEKIIPTTTKVKSTYTKTLKSTPQGITEDFSGR